MIEDVCCHSVEPANVVNDLLVVRQQVGQLLAALAVSSKCARASQQRFGALQKSETLPFQVLFGRQLAVVLTELGLVVEQVELTGAAAMKRKMTALARGLKWGGRGAIGSVRSAACRLARFAPHR